jgi:PAS domain S-box-containing protein
MMMAVTGADETYRRAWQAAPLAILTLDEHTRIRGCNPASERLFDRPLPMLVGQPVAEWCHPLDRGALRQMLAEALTGRNPARQELRFQRPDGSEIVTGFSVAPNREGDGGVVCILRDLSSEKAFRPQLLHTERMASIGTVASVVAHELNNALAGAFGCLQLLPRPDDPGAQELLDAVMGELRRAAEIVRELKGYARVEDGMNDAVRIDELVERLQRLWRYHHDASSRPPTLQLAIAADLPELRGNGNQLLQALLNLVRNAEQAMAALPEPRPPIAITARAQHGVLVIEVADRGPGVPADQRSRLFEPFYSTKPAGEGTGLGLTVVQAVAAGHGGRVEIDDTPGGGATFRLVLPLVNSSPAEPEPAPGTSPGPHPRLRGIRMLIADDEPLLRRVLERAGMGAGMVATCVGGADAAKAALRARDFDLVLLDVRMPEGGGVEVFRTILAEHPRLVPRTVFMSGELTSDMAELVGQGHGGVLSKPFDLEVLLDALDGVLARAAATDGPSDG